MNIKIEKNVSRTNSATFLELTILVKRTTWVVSLERCLHNAFGPQLPQAFRLC